MADGSALVPDADFAARIFDRLAQETADPPGITRIAFGPGEEAAHRLVRDIGRDLDLELAVDFAGNTYLTMPGDDREKSKIMIGSHMDSVRHGGNFDGAAGVICGLTAIEALRRHGIRPARDLSIMAIRAEESCWFPASYIGSRMALGQLPGEMVDQLKRSDTGRTLAEHLLERGFDPEPVRRGEPYLQRQAIACYIEPHIEQGPVLVERGFPFAIVEAITGGPRYREGRTLGTYDHAGAAPRRFRHDAVAALGEFITGVNAIWAALESEGHYAVFTFGIIGTDPEMHSFSRVPGEARFCLDTRGVTEETLAEIRARLAALIADIEHRHGIRFELGPDSGPRIARMDPAMRQRLRDAAGALGLPVMEMPSGAGHDAAAFTWAGVPTAMIFIRNRNGSHNAGEAMDMDDFAQACAVLCRVIATYE